MNGLNSSDRQIPTLYSRTRTIRSDVAERAESLLRRNGHLLHQNISCEFHEGVLVLRGSVPSYHLKQVAQAVVASLEEVVQIENRIEVVTSNLPEGAGVDRKGTTLK